MTPNALGKADRVAHRSLLRSLVSALILIVAVSLTMWWVKEQYPSAAPIAGIGLAIACMVSALFIGRRHERNLDEVQIAIQGYAMTKGYLYGAMVTVLLLSLPPVGNWLVDLVNLQVKGRIDIAARGAVHLAFIYGACMVILIQVVAAGVAGAFWWRRTR